VCCLDYSVANEGKQVAYRLNGESVLTKENMVSVEADAGFVGKTNQIEK
jgi:hypothetical protein